MIEASLVVPGLNGGPTPLDFEKSSAMYSGLPTEENQPNIDESHLNAIFALIKEFDLQENLGLHLIHRHFTIKSTEVMMGTKLDDTPNAWWTQPTPHSTLADTPIHGKIFAVTPEGNLLAYEWREGSAPEIAQQKLTQFLPKFYRYVEENNLGGAVALERLDDGGSAMSEYIVTGALNSTIMLNGIITVGDTHAPTVKGTHQVFTNDTVENTGDLKELLLLNGIQV